jgi:hypothetical protein
MMRNKEMMWLKSLSDRNEHLLKHFGSVILLLPFWGHSVRLLKKDFIE